MSIESSTQYPGRPRTPRVVWWLMVALTVVALGAGFGVGALVWAGGPDEGDDPGQARKSPYEAGIQVLTPEQYDSCVRQVSLYFEDDDADGTMREVARQLSDDDRFESVRERTQAETFEDFREVYADQPEMLNIVSPEDMGATVLAMAREGTTATQLEEPLGQEFPDAEIVVQKACPKPPTMPRPPSR
ncbi:permease-like cell division protein FtsX [Prauserella cavernicola]|uniref:FtsX extracellular domain-containing protein n=1 Tax=Prauserella cavernicola TaxID=2800127 RepID=A0A934V2X1_9PSEU|nr:permease-like cell division protein FtsX [Prauserella cavernicola]MBK1783627.1 hypothetical protein [Prauserella cavernicola]